MGAELVAVEIFFLQEPHRHHAILLQTSIKFAAIDTEGGCGPHLVSAKLLQYRKDVALLDFSERHGVVHVGLENLPEIIMCRLRSRRQNLGW